MLKKAAIRWIIYFLIREAWYPLASAWPSCDTSVSWQRGRSGTENLETARKTHCVFKNEVLKKESEFEDLGMSMEKPRKQNVP